MTVPVRGPYQFTGAVYDPDASGKLRLRKEFLFLQVSARGRPVRFERQEPSENGEEEQSGQVPEIPQKVRQALEQAGFRVR